MPTINQLSKKSCRNLKNLGFKKLGLAFNPQKKGVCLKVYTRTPKKTKFCFKKSCKS